MSKKKHYVKSQILIFHFLADIEGKEFNKF